MRTETITRNVLTVRELRAMHPQGFARAFEAHCQSELQWADWSDEWDSLKALDTIAGWNRGYSGYWWADRNYGDTWALTGKRAWAWLENVVLSDLRIPWDGQRRREVAKYMRAYPKGSTAYRPGTVEPCPLTGFYMDEVILGALREGIADGEQIGHVMASLVDVVERQINEELDARCHEDYFIERCLDLDTEFYENGDEA